MFLWLRFGKSPDLPLIRSSSDVQIGYLYVIWDKVFKNGQSKLCGRQPVKNFTWSFLECFAPNIPKGLVWTINDQCKVFVSQTRYALVMQETSFQLKC